MKSSKGVLIALLLIAFIPVTYAAMTYRITIISTGNIIINGIEVFTNEDFSRANIPIKWRDMSPGEWDTKTIYIKNTSTIQVTVSMTVTDWSPASAVGSINIQWNSEGALIQPGAAIPVVITCTVSPTTTGLTNYSCNINIIATG
jgi:hypothetical protein